MGAETTRSFLAAYTQTQGKQHQERMEHEVKMMEMQHK
jgi:hypothetical protein